MPEWGQDGGGDAAPGWGQDPAPNRLRPLNLGDVLDGTVRLARDHWRAFAISVGVVVAPLALLSGFASAVAFGPQPGFTEIFSNPEVAANVAVGTLPGDFGRLIAALALSALASLLLTPLVYGIAVHVAATGYRRGGQIDPMDSLRAAGRRYPALLGAVILMFLVPLGIYLAALILMIAAFALDAVALIVLGFIAVLAGVVVAVIAVVRLVLTIPALMIEGLGPVQALRRSNALVKGKTGLVLGTMLVVAIITTIIGIVLTYPFNAIGTGVGYSVGAVVTTVGQILSGLVTNPLMGAALVLVYFDRRVRKEGYDLTELAGELGEPQDPS